MLSIHLEPVAAKSRVTLDGVDISHHLVSVDVHAGVDDLTEATLHYRGAVVVVGDAGRVRLEQAPHYIECAKCGNACGGAKQDPVLVVDERSEKVVARPAGS